MKGFFRSKLVLSLAAFVLIASAIALSFSGNIVHSHAVAPSEQHNIVHTTTRMAKDPAGISSVTITTDTPCSTPPTPVSGLPTFNLGDLVSGDVTLTATDITEEAPEGETLLLQDTAGNLPPLTIDFSVSSVPFSFTASSSDSLIACIQGGPGGDETATINVTITPTLKLDLTQSPVCDPSAHLRGEDRGADSQCSLSNDITVPDKVIGCTLEITSTILSDFLKAIKAKRLTDILEHEEFVRSEVSLTKASSNFELIVGLLGFVLPTDCITGLADLITGGQYTALEMCLANDACTKLLEQELGIPTGGSSIATLARRSV